MFGQITISKALYDALVNQAANAERTIIELRRKGLPGLAQTIQDTRDEIAVLTEEDLSPGERSEREWAARVDAGYQRAVERRAGE